LEAERPGPGAVARGRALAARPTRPEQKAAAAAGCRWRRRLGAELPGPDAAARGRALAARPTRPEQKATAAAGSQDRRIGLRGRKKKFRAHFVVASDVILVGS
jgi:hypothetical protein